MADINLHSEISNDKDAITYILDQLRWVNEDESAVVNVSSFGGDVMLGMPLGEALLRHRGPTKMIVDGMCGSMGAFLGTYFDEIAATEGAVFMFHKAYASGDDAENPIMVKTVAIANTNFRKRMEEKGIDQDFINAIFDEDKEITLSAYEAKALGIIDAVVKTDRVEGRPVERVLAKFTNQFKHKMSKSKKHFVTLALVKADGGSLLTMFETPDGVVTEGTQLTPLNGEAVEAGEYTFEGNTITVDGEGKITGITEAPEKTPEEIEAAKAKAEADAKAAAEGGTVDADAVEAMVAKAVEAGLGKLEAALDNTLAGIGTGHKINATFSKKEPEIAKPVSPKVQARVAENAVRAKVLGKVETKK